MTDEYIPRKAALKVIYTSTAPALEIEAIPTADVVEMRHGRWIDTDNYYQRWRCSVCGCHTRDAAPNYCPNCGAKMDGGPDNG